MSPFHREKLKPILGGWIGYIHEDNGGGTCMRGSILQSRSLETVGDRKKPQLDSSADILGVTLPALKGRA